MDNIIFIGAPGSGKGTQSAKLVEKGYTHVSTGNLLRNEIAKGSELGDKVKSVLDKGQLVSDELVVELLKANINLSENSYIFDGYPRNIEQAKTLDSLLSGFGFKAIYLKLDTNRLVERLTNRRMTADGKHIYNLKTKPPKVEGICDVTGEPLVHRDDDKEETVRKRMSVFESSVNPVIEYYGANDRLSIVDANKSVEEIFSDILNEINTK